MRSPHSPELQQFKIVILQPPFSVGRSKKYVISSLGGTIVHINLTSVLLNLSCLCSPLAAGAGVRGLFLTTVSNFKPSDALIWGTGEGFC